MFLDRDVSEMPARTGSFPSRPSDTTHVIGGQCLESLVRELQARPSGSRSELSGSAVEVQADDAFRQYIDDPPGVWRSTIEAKELGHRRATDGRLAAVGDAGPANPLAFDEVTSTSVVFDWLTRASTIAANAAK
jgi:hypothetical protein